MAPYLRARLGRPSQTTERLRLGRPIVGAAACPRPGWCYLRAACPRPGWGWTPASLNPSVGAYEVQGVLPPMLYCASRVIEHTLR